MSDNPPTSTANQDNDQEKQEIINTLAVNLSNALQPAMDEIDTTMSSVYSSQELVANQLDALELVLAEFNNLPQMPSMSQYITKLAVARSNLTKLTKDVQQIVNRTENIKQSIRDHQSTFTDARKNNPEQYAGIGLDADGTHLLDS